MIVSSSSFTYSLTNLPTNEQRGVLSVDVAATERAGQDVLLTIDQVEVILAAEGGGGVAMARCARIKDNGERCKANATPGAEWCYSHDPERAEERRLNASKGGKRGGRGRSSGEIVGIKTLLSDLADKVLDGKLETGRAAVANQLINTRLRAVEVERKIREQEEFEERLAALEWAGEDRRGGKRWGA